MDVKEPSRRPTYTTVGVMVVVEVLVLTAWGYLTPGQVVSNSQATVIVGGVAVVIAVLSWIVYSITAVGAFSA